MTVTLTERDPFREQIVTALLRADGIDEQADAMINLFNETFTANFEEGRV